MAKEEFGTVIEVCGCTAKVKVGRHSDCKNCGACPGDNAIVVDAKNPIGVRPGERVAFEIGQSNMLKAAFVVYMMPLIAIFMGAAAGEWLAQRFRQHAGVYEILGGTVMFILSVIYIKHFDKSAHRKDSMQPIITHSL